MSIHHYAPQLETEAIELRKLGPVDTDLYYDMFDANRSHIAEHDPRLADSFHTIADVAEQFSPYNASHRHHFAIMEDNEFAGSTALFLRRNQEAELACWIDRDHIGRGLAREACRLTINRAFLEHGVRHIDTLIAPTNTASIRTVTKLGFLRTATLDEDDVYSLSTKN